MMDTAEESARRARQWGRPVTDDEADALLAELDAARARIAELEAVVNSLHYRMTCVDPPPTWDEIVGTLARTRKDAARVAPNEPRILLANHE